MNEDNEWSQDTRDTAWRLYRYNLEPALTSSPGDRSLEGWHQRAVAMRCEGSEHGSNWAASGASVVRACNENYF